jgi:hypothetical protein
MGFTKQYFLTTTLLIAVAPVTGAQSQVSPAMSATPPQGQPVASSSVAVVPANPSAPKYGPTASTALFDFKDSDIKFNLLSLMNTLRDSQHEGWVLAAYPDPNTHRPLIGAGFSLDVAATDHPQTDPLNPHPFVEPSSAQLWQAAGLDPNQLQKILDRFDHDMTVWTMKQYRRKIRAHTLTPELTEDEATQLLRVSAIQAVYNAKAYCRSFDELTGPQQMALSQLVFQMGVNLEEFVDFLVAINQGPSLGDTSLADTTIATDTEHWSAVQATLIDSQWAKRYSERASTVIAMFDPTYVDDPQTAQRRMEAVLHPPSGHPHKQQTAQMVRTGSSKNRTNKSSAAHGSPAHKRKTT